LYRAALGYAKHHTLVNETVVAKLLALLEMLTETRGMLIFKRGLAKAAVLLNGVEHGLSGWVLQLKEWLKDPDYIFWLGTLR